MPGYPKLSQMSCTIISWLTFSVSFLSQHDIYHVYLRQEEEWWEGSGTDIARFPYPKPCCGNSSAWYFVSIASEFSQLNNLPNPVSCKGKEQDMWEALDFYLYRTKPFKSFSKAVCLLCWENKRGSNFHSEYLEVDLRVYYAFSSFI